MENKNIELSVIIPISERHDDLKKLYHIYSQELEKRGKLFEFIFIVDGDFSRAYKDLLDIQHKGAPIKIIKFAKTFGESHSLMEGFKVSKGSVILTMASYIQMEPFEIHKLFDAYDQGNRLIITRRFPRKDPIVNRMQSSLYHFLINKLTGAPFKDITSGVRLIDKQILEEFVLYGDFHRFIPIFAWQKGIKVKEINVQQRKEDTQVRLVGPGIYIRRLLDILSLFFIIKFTKKPLRFFGLIGSSFFSVGILISIYLTILRLTGDTALSNRPALILGILLVVFGIQILSLGLVGELILFSHAREIEDYRVEEIIE